jgi:hypothetical protein
MCAAVPASNSGSVGSSTRNIALVPDEHIPTVIDLADASDEECEAIADALIALLRARAEEPNAR